LNDPGAIDDSIRRASVATYDQVIFSHPQNGTTMLALERKGTVLADGSVSVIAQPYGGAVRILDPAPLQEILGEIQFDSEESERERDLRIRIPTSKWEMLKRYCLLHLADLDNVKLEAGPHRELAQEFARTARVSLSRDQYIFQPLGFAVEDHPLPSKNSHARGMPTVRLYRIYEVQIVDDVLCNTMLAASQGCSDQDLGELARKDLQNGGKGWANSILALPLSTVREFYLARPPEERYQKIIIEDHELDESVLAILWDIEVPQYQRIKK
jgi:hypothetical protein